MVSSEFEVRPGTPADRVAIVAFQQAMARETEGRSLDPEVLERGVAGLLEDPRRGRYLVAVRGGRVIGSLMLTLEWSDWRAGDLWWIQSVYVVPEERGAGVYRALWDRVRAEARAAPDVRGLRLYVEHDNAHARAVYEHLGMTETGYRLYELEFERE